MSVTKKSIFISILTITCMAATTAYADDPDVVAMHATFITKTNTKDQDPNLDIKIYDNKHNLVAENKGVPGHWDNNSINSISLDLTKDFKRSAIEDGKVQLDIHPSGKDEWAFDYNISITYSDNAVVWQRWHDKELSEAKPTMSDSLTGK